MWTSSCNSDCGKSMCTGNDFMLQACSRILLTAQQPCRYSLCQTLSLGAIHQSTVDHIMHLGWHDEKALTALA